MLRTVCRLWRTAIDGTPTFWTTISDPHNEAYVQLVLANSATRSSLIMSGMLHACRDLAPSLRGPQNYRISHIRFETGDAASLNRVTAIEWSGIQNIHFSGSRTTFHLTTKAHLHHSLFAAHALTLHCVEIPMSSLMQFRNLRSLTLTYESTIMAPPFELPMASFLRFLREQQQLVSVKLDVSFTAVQSLIPRICLPLLDTLHLATATSSAAAFLRSVQFPSLRRLQLRTDEFEHDDDSTIAFFQETRVLSMIIGLSPSVIRASPSGLFYSQSNVIAVTCEATDTYFRLKCEVHCLAVAQYLASALRGFGGSHIRTLILDACNYPSPSSQSPLTEPTNHWADVLACVPDLTEISISNTGFAVDNLPAALESLSSSGLLHSRLSVLRFSKGSFRTAQCHAWIQYLRNRQGHGDTLSKLTFSNWGFPEGFGIGVFGKLCVDLTSHTMSQARSSEGEGDWDTDASE